MGALSRNKGAAGEREVARLLRDHLNLDITRAWQRQAARALNSDLDGLPGWSLEIKRAKKYLSRWWDQACEQADAEGNTPALIYRLDGVRVGQPDTEKWRVLLPLRSICSEDVDLDHVAEISLGAWIEIVRERIDELDCEIETRAASPAVDPAPTPNRAPAPPRFNGRSVRPVPRTTQNTPAKRTPEKEHAA